MQDHGDQQAVVHAAASSDDGEHRREHRSRTLKRARVVLSDWTTLDCRLRDVSEDGAHLVFGNSVLLPDEFRLHNISDKSVTPVRLKWQRGMEAGVEFAGPSEPLGPLKPP